MKLLRTREYLEFPLPGLLHGELMKISFGLLDHHY